MDFKKAETILLDAIKKAKKTNRVEILIECCLSLSDVYMKTRNYEKVVAVLQQGLSYATQLQSIERESSLYADLGNVYFKSKLYNDALTAHRNGYEIIKGKDEFQQNQYENLEGMALDYAALGDFKNAYESGRNAAAIKDSALQKQQDEKLLSLEAQFESEKKAKEISLLKKDQQLSYASLERQKTFQYAAYIIFFLLLLIGFLIINRYRSVQRAKRLVEIEQMRNNIARNLHDDIGSTLTSINILSKVALQTETNTAAKTNMQKIKDRSAAIMESMNDIVWAINPANDELDKIILRMKEFGAETSEQAGIQFTFTDEGGLNDIKLSLAQRNNLYLIFKEALNNSVKYSKAKKINIILKREPGNLILQVTDDGKGFDTQQQFSGNGLKNMKSRAKEMNAEIEFQSRTGSGTIVCLVMPIP